MRCYPPILFYGLLAVGFLIHAWRPIPLVGEGALPFVRWTGLALVFGGPVLSLIAIRQFRRAGTSMFPNEPAAALVTSGPYRWSRNPMYIGATVNCVGIAVFANALAPLVSVAVAFALVHPLIVGPEELHLEARFGDAYRAYRARVRRWF
ncbi:MAG: methyltransferase family protein [Candidatus Eiseniibacteriota bacterium]